MPRVRRHFEEATIVIPRDSEIREDLRLVCVDKGVAQIPAVKTKTKNGATRHGDAAVAIALAIAASEADPVEYAYRPARPRAADQSFTSAGTGSLFGLSGLDFDIPPRRGGL
jgi:phage FluMu gp28-like protein